MAKKNMSPAQLANLRPPWPKGQSGNSKRNGGRKKNRALELHKQLLGARATAKFYGLTEEEINTYDAMLETLTMAELQVLAKSDNTPVYAKNYAIAILTDMKQGKTYTIDQVRKNRHGMATQRMELTGADGQPLVQERNLTAKDVAEIMREYDAAYKGDTLAAGQPIGFRPAATSEQQPAPDTTSTPIAEQE